MTQAMEEQAAAVQHFEWYDRRAYANKQAQDRTELELLLQKTAALRQSAVRGLHLQLLQEETAVIATKEDAAATTALRQSAVRGLHLELLQAEVAAMAAHEDAETIAEQRGHALGNRQQTSETHRLAVEKAAKGDKSATTVSPPRLIDLPTFHIAEWNRDAHRHPTSAP